MADTTTERFWDRLKERVREWVEAVEEALAPDPELVPIPVRGTRGRAADPSRGSR